MLATTQIIVVSLYVHGARLLDLLFFAFGEDDAQRLYDRLRDVVLNGEDVFDLAVVFLRPEVRSVCDVHELRRDTKAVPHLPYASFENGRHFQFLSDLSNVFVLSLERERRSARGYAERLDLRKSVDDL